MVFEAFEVTIKSKYVIEKEFGGGLYEGKIISSNSESRVFLIQPTDTQKAGIDELQYITATSRFLVTVNHLIESYENSKNIELMVIEPVMPIFSFFKEKMETFQNLEFDEHPKAKWWNHIQDSFTEIFRDVVHGMICLSSFGHICGDIQKHVYVDERNRGKVLSLLDKSRSSRCDIIYLIKMMNKIITLPFNGNDVDDSFNLPAELLRFLEFSDPNNLRVIPMYWLLNHPFFWSAKERISFIMDLRANLKENVWDWKKLDGILRRQTSYKNLMDWQVIVQGKRFENIFNSSDSMLVKQYDTKSPIEIIRFMTACYNHINDKDNCKRHEDKYAPDYVENKLRNFFPSIYVNLYEALCLYDRELKEASPLASRRVKAFENWSSLYFA